jgi:hypothetical protein
MLHKYVQYSYEFEDMSEIKHEKVVSKSRWAEKAGIGAPSDRGVLNFGSRRQFERGWHMSTCDS